MPHIINKNMKQIKEIINSRITNILQLHLNIAKYNCGEVCETDRYEFIVGQKRTEKYRSIRENEVLFAMNQSSLSHRETAQNLYEISVDIISAYDNEYEKYREKFSNNLSENFRKLYSDFFNTHGFEQKSKYLSQVFEKGFSNLSPAILLGWLSQWSKKIYHEILQKQIAQSFQKRTLSKPALSQIKVKEPSLDLKKTQLLKQQESQPEAPYVSFHSRSTVHSLIYTEMKDYYKFYDGLDLDIGYVKNLRKRNKKDDLLKPTVIQKAVQILIETTPNKDLSIIMKGYSDKYIEKFGVIAKSSPKKQHIFHYKKKLQFSVVPKQKKQDNPMEVKAPTPESKLLSPKFSEIEFLKPQEIEVRIKKLKLLNPRTNKKNLQFPEITRIRNQMEKKMSFNQLDTKQALFIEKKKFSISTMEKSPLQKQFLICEGLSRHQISSASNELIAIESKPRRQKKSSMKFGQSDVQYNDEKFKTGKTFQLNLLSKNKKALVIKNRIANDLKDLYEQ